MKNFDSPAELQAHWNNIDAIANDNGVTSHWLQMRMLHSGDRRLAAISAWRDLSPDFQGSESARLNTKIFNVLFDRTAPLSYGDDLDKNERNYTYKSYFDEGFPSQFEAGGRRLSFGHLIDALANHRAFEGEGYEKIADMLNKPYVIYDGGADINNVFLAKDLERLNIEVEDLYDSANYPMILAMKLGKKLVFEIEKDMSQISGLTPGVYQLGRLQALKDKMKGRDADSSIWTATRPSQDGKSLEVVLMTGNMNDRSDRQVVARWHYQDKDDKGNIVLKRLQYDGIDEQLKVLSAYKRGNFMDIENDGDIKRSVERWIKEGESKWLSSIPGGLEEVIVRPWSPFNIGKFEFREVVKPFWDKYKDLSPEAFAAKWEEVRHAETYTFEEKYWDLNFEGIIDIFRPDIVHISALRHGSRGSIKGGGSLGGRDRPRGEPWLFFNPTRGNPMGGAFDPSTIQQNLKKAHKALKKDKSLALKK